jgi:hypothetical protein
LRLTRSGGEARRPVDNSKAQHRAQGYWNTTCSPELDLKVRYPPPAK